MVKIIIVFMLIIVVLALLIVFAVALRTKNGIKDFDSQYLDEAGRHKYYERSIIEKNEFRRRHPGNKGLRTFKSLFFGHDHKRE